MWTVNDGRDTVKGRHLRANPRATLAVDVEEFPYAFVVVRGAVTVDEYASDLLAWPTTIADRYVRRAARPTTASATRSTPRCCAACGSIVGPDIGTSRYSGRS